MRMWWRLSGGLIRVSSDRQEAKMREPFGALVFLAQGRRPWLVGEMGVAEGVAMPMNSVMELLVKLESQTLPEASIARPRGLLMPAA
jgi:hypothetical protein